MAHDNSNRGTLNHTREKRSERSPDFYGRIQISGDVLAELNAGKPIRLSGWLRDGKYGEFISLAADVERPREEQRASGTGPGFDWKGAEQRERQNATPDAPAPSTDDFDDSIPF